MDGTLLKVSLRFGGTCCLRPQGRRINHTRSKHEVVATCLMLVPCKVLFASNKLGLFFDDEDGGERYH